MGRGRARRTPIGMVGQCQTESVWQGFANGAGLGFRDEESDCRDEEQPPSGSSQRQHANARGVPVGGRFPRKSPLPCRCWRFRAATQMTNPSVVRDDCGHAKIFPRGTPARHSAGHLRLCRCPDVKQTRNRSAASGKRNFIARNFGLTAEHCICHFPGLISYPIVVVRFFVRGCHAPSPRR